MQELKNVDGTSLARFLAGWYGLPEPSGSERGVPRPLAQWYEAVAAGGERVTQYYQVRPPDGLDEADGRMVFCDDPGGEFVWAYGQDGDDPPTFERAVGEQSWRETGFPLSSLLLHVAVAGAVMSARIGLVSTDIAGTDFDRAAAHLRKLPGRLWSWPDPNLSFYEGEGVLAYGGRGGDPAGSQLLIGARDEKFLSSFDGIGWEWDSRADG
ncbi:hypothetical protein ACQPZX_33695 [Actinoplanes sp. CA-142083]|uniref:hypothetical protein n=1 Tax=Actinoplanes sp. CA-142083 TaxID=3239903 RepID=UPI003D8FF886